MKTRPQPQPGIERIKLYTPGVKGRLAENIRRLGSNENLYGPSPMAIDAMNRAATEVWKYPSVDHEDLRMSIADIHNLPADQIIIGVGSDEILALIAQAYAGVNDAVLMTEHGFEVYGIVAHAVGADLLVAPEHARKVDVDAILATLSDHTKIIYIANPANPTGTLLDTAELTALVDNIPPHVLVVLDGAYAEFADENGAQFDGGASLALARPNVIMTRTLSKLYGLGGLRVGWALADQAIIDTLNRIRGPFNMSNIALAGAQAAIIDQAYYQARRKAIVGDRARLITGLVALGIEVDPSQANFVLARFAGVEQAKDIHGKLLEAGYLVRMVGHYGFPAALRITIGTRADVDAVLAVLTKEFSS